MKQSCFSPTLTPAASTSVSRGQRAGHVSRRRLDASTVEAQLLGRRSWQLQNSCRRFRHKQVRSSQRAHVLQLEEASPKKRSCRGLVSVGDVLTCKKKKDSFPLRSCFFFFFHPPIVFPLACTQAANEIRTMLPIVLRCLGEWMHVRNAGKKARRNTFFRCRRGQIW